MTHPPKPETQARLSKEFQKSERQRGPRSKEVTSGIAMAVGNGKVYVLKTR